jgi:hypothetical protein
MRSEGWVGEEKRGRKGNGRMKRDGTGRGQHCCLSQQSSCSASNALGDQRGNKGGMIWCEKSR